MSSHLKGCQTDRKIRKRLSAGAVNFLFDQLFARLPFESASNGEQCCVCVCVFQAGYVSVCEYALSLVGSAQLQCEVISLQNTTTQPTHTRTHTFTWTRNIPIFSSNPCQLPGRMAGMCVRHVYSEHAGLVSRCQELVCMWKSRSAAVLDMPRCS